MLRTPSKNSSEEARGRPAVSEDELFHLCGVAVDPTIEHAVQVVRDFVGMDIAYTTVMTPTEQIFESLSGDGVSFGVAEGTVLPVGDTYCQRILAGLLPNVMPDLDGFPLAAAMPVTAAANVRAFVSVPLELSDGSVSGTLCAASHDPQPDLGNRDLQFLNVFARLIADQIERRDLEQAKRELAQQAAAAEALIAAVTARDSYTADHSRSVVGHALSVARALGLAATEISDVENVALLHDIGKIGIPDVILSKSGPLDDSEWETMRRHPIIGEQMIAEIPGLKQLAKAIRAEHERWDGGGYPDGLSGEEIPIASRITLVCDAYEAMTSDRPYRRAMDPSLARAEIEANLGKQFCPTAGRALLDHLVGHLVSGPA